MLKNRQTLLALGDVLMLLVALLIMLVIRFDWHTQATLVALQKQVFLWVFALWIIVFFIFDLYDLRRVNPNPRNIGLLVSAMALNIGLAILALYLFPHEGVAPKTNLALVAGISFILLVVWRRSFYHLFTARIPQRIGILGSGELMTTFKKQLSGYSELGSIVRQWDTPHDALLDTTKLDTIIADHTDPLEVLRVARAHGAQPEYLVEAYQHLFGKIPVELMTNEQALLILSKAEHSGVAFLYRLIETVLAGILLIITSPVLLIAMLAILIEDGKPFFIKQARTGKNGVTFKMYKLRSMRALAPDGSAEVSGATWAQDSDPRVTKVGKVLRKLHIDEIPQMWNIIRGDLALVGPRAERPELVTTLEQEIPYYYLRHTIKPGFTGWAQIKFRYARSVMDSKEKFTYDLYYLANQTPLLDIGIVLKTVQIIFTH